jgi:phosphocarrier protein HPr
MQFTIIIKSIVFILIKGVDFLKKKSYVIVTETGLHARPAAEIVKVASKFSSTIEIEKNERKVNLKSILNVMSLGLGKGQAFTIYVDGVDEEEVLQELDQFLKSEGLVEP